jgi:hypothetical protein
MTPRVSLAELAAADIRIRPAEAVAIVVEICRQYHAGRIAAVPSPGVIRLTSEGEIVVEGPIATSPGTVARAAHLLSDLLPDIDAPAQYRASGGLRLVIARALGALDLPPYSTLGDFCAALARFTVEDLAAAARTLYQAWASSRAARDASVTPALTISDVRRARRATGLSLDDLSAVADVPAIRLRELEWGYMRHWRADADGRDRVVRYARAAGLDEELVLSIAWPMIEDAALVHDLPEPEAVTTTLVPSGTQALAPLTFPVPAPRDHRRLSSWGLAAGAGAVLALTTLAFGRDVVPVWPSARTVATPVTAEPGDRPPSRTLDDGPIAARAEPPTAAVAASASRTEPDAGDVAVPAKISDRAARNARPPARAAIRPPAAPQKRPPAKRKSFLQRELFRIVIK